MDQDALARDEVEIVVQINGKVRGHITVPADADRKTIEAMAMDTPATRKHLEGKSVRKVIVVPGRLVNIAAS